MIGVGVGSERPPRFLRLAYEPRGAKATLALVGKGVVFDSGGLSLKTPGGMETMKTDMSGAAAVVATMSVLRAVGVRSRVTASRPIPARRAMAVASSSAGPASAPRTSRATTSCASASPN